MEGDSGVLQCTASKLLHKGSALLIVPHSGSRGYGWKHSFPCLLGGGGGGGNSHTCGQNSTVNRGLSHR